MRAALGVGLLALGLIVAGPGFGHGGGGRSGAAGASHDGMSQREPPVCGAGYVLKDGACVQVSGSALPDRALYEQGRRLALSGHYAEAIPVLEAVRRTDDPMVFTMRGFAWRKLGHFDRAMVLYRQALAIDPGNVDTHEYMGEGYVTMGRPDLARIELAAVRQGCGGPECEQYEDLAKAIETGAVE